MAGNETRNYQERNEVTLKFGKGLMDEPFTSKNGKQLVKILIPNADKSDSRPWESFVVPANFVHENKYGKGMWMKLPEDGMTKLTRNVVQGVDENGKKIWGKESREVSNTELKALVEAYKEKSRASVMGDLSGKKAEMKSQPVTAHEGKKHEDLPFR